MKTNMKHKRAYKLINRAIFDALQFKETLHEKKILAETIIADGEDLLEAIEADIEAQETRHEDDA